MWFYKSGCILYSVDYFTWDLYVFSPEGEKGVSTHGSVLLQGLELYVQLIRYLNYHTKNI